MEPPGLELRLDVLLPHPPVSLPHFAGGGGREDGDDNEMECLLTKNSGCMKYGFSGDPSLVSRSTARHRKSVSSTVSNTDKKL